MHKHGCGDALGSRGNSNGLLDGLEARLDGQCMAVLQDDRTFKHMACFQWNRRLEAFSFEPCEPDMCPCISDAQ